VRGQRHKRGASGLDAPAQAEPLIRIEDAAELRLSQPHVVSLEARPANMEGAGEVTVRALVRNALRMHPDRIIVGEVRGGICSGDEHRARGLSLDRPRELLRKNTLGALSRDFQA